MTDPNRKAFTLAETKSFISAVLHGFPLDDAVEWIRDNLTPDAVFDDDALEEWALSQGWREPPP